MIDGVLDAAALSACEVGDVFISPRHSIATVISDGRGGVAFQVAGHPQSATAAELLDDFVEDGEPVRWRLLLRGPVADAAGIHRDPPEVWPRTATFTAHGSALVMSVTGDEGPVLLAMCSSDAAAVVLAAELSATSVSALPAVLLERQRSGDLVAELRRQLAVFERAESAALTELGNLLGVLGLQRPGGARAEPWRMANMAEEEARALLAARASVRSALDEALAEFLPTVTTGGNDAHRVSLLADELRRARQAPVVDRPRG